MSGEVVVGGGGSSGSQYRLDLHGKLVALATLAASFLHQFVGLDLPQNLPVA